MDLTTCDCTTHTAELFRATFPENAEGMVFFGIFIGITDPKATISGFCIQEKIEEVGGMVGGNADEYNARVFLMA